MGRTFAVVAVPVRDTVLGGMTAEVPGSRVDAVACFEYGDGEPHYHVDLVATGFHPLQIQDARRRLRSIFTVLLETPWEPGHWHARGRVPLGNITNRALRVLGAGGAELAAPWLDIQGGIACIRLRPRGRDADEAFCHHVQQRLELCGLRSPVRLEQADERVHDEHRRCLDPGRQAPRTQAAVA